MAKQLLLSFIIPMYNAEKYIGNCIESILAQHIDKDRFEIIVIDDGSNDNGGSVAMSYDCVKCYKQDNKGQSASRNRGIELAEGQYLCFVDADDALVPNSIDFCLNVAIERDLDMVTYDVITCLEESVPEITPRITNIIDDVFTGKEYIEKYNFNNGVWLYLIRRRSLGSLRFIEGRYGEDGMFTMELLMNIERVAHVNNQCYYYFWRPGSTVTKKDEVHLIKMIEDYLFVYDYMQGLISQNADSLTQNAISRCKGRSESYIFFLLIRLLKFPNSSLIKSTIAKLKQKGIYPVKQPYPESKYTILSMIVNNYFFLRVGNRLYNLIKK